MDDHRTLFDDRAEEHTDDLPVIVTHHRSAVPVERSNDAGVQTLPDGVVNRNLVEVLACPIGETLVRRSGRKTTLVLRPKRHSFVLTVGLG